MLLVYLCDDVERELHTYEEIVKEYIAFQEWSAEVVCATTSATKLLKVCDEQNGIGCYILDVELDGEIQGFQLAEKIREKDPRGFIIMLTSHNDLLPNVFKYHLEVLNYIQKADLSEIKEELREAFRKAYERYLIEVNGKDSYLQIKSSSKTVYIKVEDISSIKTSSIPHHLDFHLEGRKISTYGRIKDIIEKLPDTFVQCHRATIVNIGHVEEIDRKNLKVKMYSGVTYDISYRFRKAFVSKE